MTSPSFLAAVTLKVESAARWHIEKEGLTPHPSWCLKVVQLYETTLVRHGVMMVGPPGSGKSSTISTLQVFKTYTKYEVNQ